MSFEILPAHDLPLAEQAAVANAGFAGYVGGWHDFDVEALARFLSLQGTDLFLSRFVRNADGRLVGFGYINRTGRVLRLTGMAIIPEARGSGAAGHLLQGLFEEGKARGDEAMMLEVIEQNPRGCALYRRHGFRELMRLFGWRKKPSDGKDESQVGVEIKEIPATKALAWPCAVEYPDIPWQVSRHAAAKAANTRAFCAAGVCLVLSDPGAADDAPVRLHALFSDGPDGMKWSELRTLLTAVTRRYFSSRELFAPAIFPEGFGTEFFEPLGFNRETISQFLMRRDF